MKLSTVLTVKNLIAAGRFKEAEEKTQVLLKENPDEIVYNGCLQKFTREREKRKKQWKFTIF